MMEKILVVTELCKGGSLLSLLKSNKSMDETMVLKILNEIASGMDHLHKQGVIHRDIAARNILLTASMDVKVSDFGMSRVVNSDEIDNQQKTTSTIGPLRWMAPEYMFDRIYSTKSDVWSFGVVIYEVTMRKVPYESLTNEKVILHISNTTQLPLDLPVQYPKLAILMKSCMSRDIKQRPDFESIVQFFNNLSESSVDSNDTK